VAPKRVVILGSTGSIGCQALDLIAQSEGLSVCGLSAGSNADRLVRQARRFGAAAVALCDEAAARRAAAQLPACRVFAGSSGMTELVRHCRPDVLLTGVMGAAGLEPTLAGIDCGATLAIANKETLVMAGAIVMPAARAAGVPVLPVDSEHSAIFQCLQAGRRDEVRRVVITASGGALRDWDDPSVDEATVEQALAHPTWNMGRKVTIDSATMVNKALEMVEAHWLFGLQADQIEVLLHPQSIVHSLVEFQDGSVIAQLGQPDMTLPIAYALHYPRRMPRAVASLDLAAVRQLTFEPLGARFVRAVNLGYEAIRRGGVAGAVLNAANEAAVEAFLAGRVRFGQIVALVEEVLHRSREARPSEDVSLQGLYEADHWARTQVAAVAEATQQTRML